MSATDTIYALASGAGVSALSVIRISGSSVRNILDRIGAGSVLPRQASVRSLSDPDTGCVLDEALVLWMPGPRSYTGEDCAELHIHGSRAVLSAVFSVLSNFDAVRLAEPGEFTRRAVVNGKLDLVQAEGLGDLLAAQTEAQRRQAVSHMLGRASNVFDSWRERLLLIRADLEATLDFADEAGVAEVASERVDGSIRMLLAELEDAMARSSASEAIREGLKVVLAGLPNTGKSSLLNALVRREAAIVSSIPGTTRDVIEVFLDMGGWPVILTDTAGLHASTSDEIEREGIRRTRSELDRADIVVWIMSPDVSGSERYDHESFPDLLVCNKIDLKDEYLGLFRNNLHEVPLLRLSARDGLGIPEFLAALTEVVSKRIINGDTAVVVTRRQRDATLQSIRYLNESLDTPKDAFELKAEHIRRAAEEIGRITGRTEVEEWLGSIFSRFCIGK